MESKPYFIVTPDELVSIVEDAVRKVLDERVDELCKPSHVVKGVTGLANALGISRPTAHKLVQSHQIDEAITYISPKLFEIDVDKAKRLLTKERIR